MVESDGARSRAKAIFDILAPLWPDAVPLLSYRDGFELLIAVVLSAQCTDEQVNRATPGLFARWPDAEALGQADLAQVEETIRSVGFYRTKARHIIASARMMAESYDGRPPPTMEKLLTLPGVGRKTANLVLSACYGQPGIIVDTHVLRACFRLAIRREPPGSGKIRPPDPLETERAIASLVEPESWTRFSHALNRHGKHVCKARNPDCGICPVASMCPRIGLPPFQVLHSSPR